MRIAAISTATGIPHRKSPASGLASGGTSGRVSALVDSPVHCPKPVKTSAPTPLASRQGSSRSTSCGPPRPAASTIITAATRGPPRMVEIAVVEPAVPSTSTVLASASLFTARTMSSARPLPTAIRGASGPSTTPRGSVARAAKSTPGSSFGPSGGPPRPWTGTCPPCPVARVTTGPSSSPASSSAGSGHHQGARSYPAASGSESHTQCCSSCCRLTKEKQASAMGTPRTTETSNRRT